MKTVCVCGGGSLGHVIAGYLSAKKGARVNILTQRPQLWQQELDIHTPEELISSNHNVDEVCRIIGADSLSFLSHEGMLKAGRRTDLCLACFNAKYPTELYQE